jgi:hypothetical protein
VHGADERGEDRAHMSVRAHKINAKTGGSQCLVGGAEGIRTVGPLCGYWRLRRARSFSRVTALKPIRELSSERSCREILVENGGTPASFPRVKRPKRTGSSNPLRSSNEALRTDRRRQNSRVASDKAPQNAAVRRARSWPPHGSGTWYRRIAELDRHWRSVPCHSLQR